MEYLENHTNARQFMNELSKFDHEQLKVLKDAIMMFSADQVAYIARYKHSAMAMKSLVQRLRDGVSKEQLEFVSQTCFNKPQIDAICIAFDANVDLEYIKEHYIPSMNSIEMNMLTRQYVKEENERLKAAE